MNFLFVNHNASAPAYGNPYRTFYMAKNLVRLGHRVTVVAAGHSHLRLSQPAQEPGMAEEVHEGVKYIFLPTSAITARRASRAANILRFVWSYHRYWKPIAEKAKPDVVVEGSTYILPFFVSARIAKKTGAKLIYEVRDLWPASPIEISGKSKYRPFFLLIGLAQKYAVRTADCIVSTLRYADRYFTKHVHPPKAFAHIQNGIDADLYAEAVVVRGTTLEAIEAIKARHSGCIGYTGGMGAANGMDSLVRAAKALSERNIAIILVGQGERREEFEAYAKDQGLSNLYVFKSVSKPEVIPITQAFDLAFVGGVYRSYHRYGSSPNKVFDYMMSGVPFLYCITTDDTFVEDSGCGIVVKYPTSESVAAAAAAFFEMPAEARSQMGANGRKAALEKYEYRVLTKAFLDVIEELRTADAVGRIG